MDTSERVTKQAKRGHQRVIALATVLCTLYVPTVRSAEYTFRPEVYVIETYTDNLNQSMSGAQRTETIVTEIVPQIYFGAKGRQTDIDLYAKMQNYLYGEELEDHRSFTQYQFEADRQFVRDHFSIAIRGARDQQNINREEPIAYESLDRQGRLDVDTLGIEPYYRDKLGKGFIQMRYGFNTVRYEDHEPREIDDSDINTFGLIYNNSPRPADKRWEFRYDVQHIDYDTRDSSLFSNGVGELSFFVGRDLRLYGYGGFDYNEYSVDTDDYDLKGIWGVGGVLRPTRDLSLQVEANRRFFGNGYLVRFEQKGNRVTWDASYDKELGTVALDQLTRSVFQTTEDGDTQPSFLTLSTDTYVRRTVSGGFAVRADLVTLRASAYHESRDYLPADYEDTVLGANVSIGGRVTRKTAYRLAANRSHYEFEVEAAEFTYWTGVVGLDRPLGRNAEVWLEYRRLQRDSDSEFGSFEENNVQAGFRLEL